MENSKEDVILIADSGSTKTDWKLLTAGGEQHGFKTAGFNPYFQTTQVIYKEISLHLVPDLIRLSIPGLFTDRLKIFFYGAGCSTLEKNNIVFEALRRAFPMACIEVEHDLLAAARALCGKEKGIAAILGTGSNSCFYDGKQIVENVASLGFILGDEGSGAHIGKQFMQDYLYNDVPKSIAERFNDSYKLNREIILDAIYKQTMPSKFLASFSKFIGDHRDEQYISALIRGSFLQFFNKHICKYNSHKEVDLNCVGSVAYHYQDILREVAEEKKVNVGRIIESPIYALTVYHSQEGSVSGTSF
jgi:N-acetylglucosamine kinase-like BadF-type ATPase